MKSVKINGQQLIKEGILFVIRLPSSSFHNKKGEQLLEDETIFEKIKNFQIIPIIEIPAGMEARKTFFEKDDWDFIEDKELKAIEWIAFKISYPVRQLLTILGKIRRGRVFYCRHIKLKSNGKERIVDEPKKELKIIQSRIKNKLFSELPIRKDVYGFSGGNILGALQPHLKSKNFLMLDIKDAFPSITSSSVLNFFLFKKISPGRKPELSSEDWSGHFSWRVSKILKELCIFQEKLPQGAPTSPRLFDLVFYEIDEFLVNLANNNEFIYTRYADNLFFSSEKYLFTKNKLIKKIVDAVQLENSPHLILNCHKIRSFNNLSGAIRALGLNIIEGQLHNTRDFKRRFRLHLHHIEWLKENNQDYEESYQKLMGMMGWAISETVQPKLWEKALFIKKTFKAK